MEVAALRITRRNSTYQVLHSLTANRQKRSATRTFLVEGVIPINRALAHGWTFAALIYEHGAQLSQWARDVLVRAAAPVAYELSRELLADISGKDQPSELIALLQMPGDDLSRIPLTPDLLVAVVDRPASPGNLGTLIRSGDAFGVHGVIVSGHAVDVYDPATLTASRGSLFGVPVVRVESHTQVAQWLSAVRAAVGSCLVVGADEAAAIDLETCDLTAPVVAIFGNETHGVSRAYREMCDVLVKIPMSGAATSLNVSVAASVVLYEARRQRRA
jgi:TrmH family RNA methyltransferase